METEETDLERDAQSYTHRHKTPHMEKRKDRVRNTETETERHRPAQGLHAAAFTTLNQPISGEQLEGTLGPSFRQ